MAASKNLLNELVCALADDEHFVKEPIVLSNCGHSVCKSCASKHLNQSMKCKCGKVTERDLKNDSESSAIKSFIQICLSSLYEEVEKRLNSQICKFKNLLSEQTETVNLHVKFIEEEVELRIESIKIQLDEMFDKFKIELRTIKEDMIKVQEENNISDYSNQFEENLNALREDIQNKNNQNVDKFYTYQENLSTLNEIMKSFNNRYELKFCGSKEKIGRELIGQIVYSKHQKPLISHRDLCDKLKYSNYEVIKLNSSPRDICILPNNHIACTSFSEKNITVYDKNFNLVKTIAAIGNRNIFPLGIAINNRNEVYIADHCNDCIILTDTDFNQIKLAGTTGSNSNQFKNPFYICCTHSALFVCDYSNKRLQILDLNLQFLDTMKFDYYPVSVSVSEKTICVNGTHFYDLATKTLKQKYNYAWSRVSQMNSVFYVYSPVNSRFNCYDEDAALIEDIDTKRFNILMNDSNDGCISYFNNKFPIISLHSSSQFLKFQ